MKRKGVALSLPPSLVAEAESNGGSAGEMFSFAPLPAWSSPQGMVPAAGAPAPPGTTSSGPSQPATSASPSALPAAAGNLPSGTMGDTNTPESPRTRAKTKEQLDRFNLRPLDERVHELTTALIREFLAKHGGDTAEVAELRDAFERAFPRTDNSVSRRSVICDVLDMTEPSKASKDSLLETLIRRQVQPAAMSIESGVFSADGLGGDASGAGSDLVAQQNSVYFVMSPDGLGLDVNGLALGQGSSSASYFRVKDLHELDLEHADVIGRGAGGRVMRARHRPTGEVLAVKEIYLGSDDVIKQIEAEISVLWGTSNRRKHHTPSPFLINCQGIFYADGTLYVVMELMDGSLKDAVDVHGAFSEDELKAMTYQMLHGLQYMHFDKKQLHRDIKPHNVLYNRNGWVKLSDFGIASDKMATAGAMSRQTFCGTLVYMSPNRAEGEAYGYEGDIWSLGITLYQMAVNALPVANNIFDVIQMRAHPPRLPDTKFSAAFRDFIALCLDPDATAATTITVRQLLLHEWIVDMTLDRSQRIVQDVCKDILTRTQRAAAGHKPVGLGHRDDIFATLDDAIGL
jgi:hypothetical protein